MPPVGLAGRVPVMPLEPLAGAAEAVATGSSTNFTLSIGTATRCSPTPRKPPTPITTALMSPLLSVRRSLIDPRLSLLSLYTFRPTSFEARQLPLNDELSDAAAGAAVVA